MSERPDPDLLSPLDQMASIEEPPFDPEDTSPTVAVRRGATAPITNKIRRGSPWLNWLLWSAAVVITLGAALLYLQQSQQPGRLIVQPTTVAGKATLKPTLRPTEMPTRAPTQLPAVVPAVNADLAVPAEVISETLMRPGDTAPAADKIYRMQTAYTIAPVRNRAATIEYTIQQGDTLDTIAKRFGLSKDTLVWNNDGIYVNRLFPGDTLSILPQDGIQYKTASEETIQAIADKYKVSPYAIIDSEYNHLQNAAPTTLLPVSQTVMVPGGTSTRKAVYWNPGIVPKPAVSGSSGGSGASSNASGEIAFGGGAGSCGYQPNAGGSGSLRVPLPPGYQVVRGFSSFHSGIDLAMPTGTTVFAADGGTVIFAGWSDWGYGNTIVLAHGSMLTLYGHLSRINVSCGQRVSGGQPIGAVGSTGNSSGPHLHFEIRPGGGEPVNPVGYLGF